MVRIVCSGTMTPATIYGPDTPERNLYNSYTVGSGFWGVSGNEFRENMLKQTYGLLSKIRTLLIIDYMTAPNNI